MFLFVLLVPTLFCPFNVQSRIVIVLEFVCKGSSKFTFAHEGGAVYHNSKG
jgi:hypothetical protein